MTDWLSVPDAAETLGVSVSRVRELLRERHLVATRRGDNNALYLPAGQIAEGESGPSVVPTVRGTVIVLSDAGLTDDEIVAWLLEDSDELGMSPLEALREGRRAPVRRLAQTLF